MLEGKRFVERIFIQSDYDTIVANIVKFFDLPAALDRKITAYPACSILVCSGSGVSCTDLYAEVVPQDYESVYEIIVHGYSHKVVDPESFAICSRSVLCK